MNGNGNGIQSITWPKTIRSIKFEIAPPSIIDKPIFTTGFNFTKIRTKIIITHTKHERIKATLGTLFKIPKAAPEL